MAQNNWRLVRNNKIGTKDDEIWWWTPGMEQAGLGSPDEAVTAGATHWKKVVDWEAWNPGMPTTTDKLEGEVQDVMDMIYNPEEDDDLPF